MKYHLAQLNIAYIKGKDMNDPIMAGFVAQLDEINALAENPAADRSRMAGLTSDPSHLANPEG